MARRSTKYPTTRLQAHNRRHGLGEAGEGSGMNVLFLDSLTPIPSDPLTRSILALCRTLFHMRGMLDV